MSRPIKILLPLAAITLLFGQALAQTPAADALLKRADVAAKSGKYDEAVAAAKEALASLETAFGAADARLSKPLRELARFYELTGRYKDAEGAYRRAIGVLEWQPNVDQKDLAELKAKLALVSAKSASERAAASANPPGSAHTPDTRRSFARRDLMTPPSAAASPVPPPVPAARPIPQFPWPPPASSARYGFSQETFKRYATVGEVSSAILNALELSGYVERSFFRTGDGGVALVTRLERIGEDGSSAIETERWPAGFDNAPASFVNFVRGLFFAKAGHYRVIVFVLQEASFTQSHETVTAQNAEDWLLGGANKLPPEMARHPFGKDSTCTALIYEFASDGSAVKGVISSLTGKQHLQKAGLLASLEKPN
jgi:Tetratricopeptide repeat